MYLLGVAMSSRILLSYSLIRVRQHQGMLSRMLYPFSGLLERPMHTSTRRLTEEELQEKNPFYEKYREKLEKAGSSPIKLESLRHTSSSKESHPAAVRYPFTDPPSLNKIMVVDLIVDKTADEIAKIWREYHSNKDCISAVIPADVYVQLHAKASMCPLFIYPLPRDEGLEFIYSQFNGHQFYFTTLLNYQLHQENAPVCLTLTHYTELQESKGIVLMNGDLDSKVLKASEAQFLANLVQLYYASNDGERFSMVKQFNHQPEEFKYQRLVDQLQNTGIEVPDVR